MIQDGNEHLPVFKIQGSVHDEEIPIINPSTDHGVTGHPNVESSGGMPDKMFVEIQFLFGEILRWGREACGDFGIIEGTGNWRQGGIGGKYGRDGGVWFHGYHSRLQWKDLNHN